MRLTPLLRAGAGRRGTSALLSSAMLRRSVSGAAQLSGSCRSQAKRDFSEDVPLMPVGRSGAAPSMPARCRAAGGERRQASSRASPARRSTSRSMRADVPRPSTCRGAAPGPMPVARSRCPRLPAWASPARRSTAKREPLDAGERAPPFDVPCRSPSTDAGDAIGRAALGAGMVASGASIKPGDRSALREYQFITSPGVAYDGCDDFPCFLTEAEILRDFGQRWRPRRAKSEPPFAIRRLARPRQMETADAPA
jgi:hypothetical protein